DLEVWLLRRIDRQPAAFRTHLGIGVHFEPELVDIKIVGARLVQHKDRKMVRFSYHYFLQNCDVGRIQGSEPARFSKIAILVCVLQKNSTPFQGGVARRSHDGVVSFVVKPVSASSQRAKKTLHHKTSRNEPKQF